jgi:hypothetical protein
MINATEIFKSRADAFRLERFAEVAEYVEFPMPFFANGGVKVLTSGKQLEAELAKCCETLSHTGYHTTTFEVLESECQDEDHMRFDVRWTNKTRQGRTISWLEVSYFMSRRPDGGYVISMVEVLDEQAAYLMAV